MKFLILRRQSVLRRRPAYYCRKNSGGNQAMMLVNLSISFFCLSSQKLNFRGNFSKYLIATTKFELNVNSVCFSVLAKVGVI